MDNAIVRRMSRAAIVVLSALIAAIALPGQAMASHVVYRFYNPRAGTHFYTASESERDDVQRRLSSVFSYEGIGYRAPARGENPDLDCRLAPLFRFYNLRTGSHFYTMSESERDDVIQRYPDIFSYEGVAYQVVGSPCQQVQPVYRLYNARSGTHFYTASAEEKAYVEAHFGSVYRFEGVAYYALPQAETPRPRVKNIIIMIGDGMGYETLQMTDYYRYGTDGAGLPKMTFAASMSTYSAGGVYDPIAAWNDLAWLLAPQTDSAAAATAMSTGQKTRPPRIGENVSGGCLTHLMETAETHGKATGVVSSMPLSHATPAGFTAHGPDRAQCPVLAAQMVCDSALDVIAACGNPCYTEDATQRAKPEYTYIDECTWSALLSGTAGADADGDGDADSWQLVTSRNDIVALGSGATPPRVCAIPQVFTTLQQSRSGDYKAAPYAVAYTPGLPTLAEMTAAALNVVDEDPDGFVLMIEGGAIDQAAHLNATGRAIEETAAFEDAVRLVDAWVSEHSSWSETLLIVTADHDTGRLSGPGTGVIDGVTVWADVINNGAGVLPGTQWNSKDHTAALVPFFAKGSAACRFVPLATGTDPVRGAYLDNTDIARVCFPLLAE